MPRPAFSRRVPIPGLSEGTLARIRAALAKAVAHPTGTGYKTVRTTEIAHRRQNAARPKSARGQADHAWFAGYAPADKPRIAFAVVLEHAGSGGKAAGPVARQLVEAFLADGVLEPARVTMRRIVRPATSASVAELRRFDKLTRGNRLLCRSRHMGEAAEHLFNRKSAAPVLIQAMQELAERSGRTLEDMDQMRLGDAYDLAVAVYGENLPEYWRVWNSWNILPDTPAPMGDL